MPRGPTLGPRSPPRRVASDWDGHRRVVAERRPPIHNPNVLDMHNHVLFGLDDGCRNPVESDALAQAMRAVGHEGIVATPHIRPGVFDNTLDKIRRRRDETRPIIEEAGLSLYLGAEYYFSPELLAGARDRRLLTLGESSRYVLIELPTMSLPPRLDDLLYEVRLTGYVPVIAHPERCRGVADAVDWALERFRTAQVLLQLDLGSLVGHYGRTARRTAQAILDRGAYHVAAADLHRAEDVPSIVRPSLDLLRRRLRRRRVETGLDELIQHNPRRILENASYDDIRPV